MQPMLYSLIIEFVIANTDMTTLRFQQSATGEECKSYTIYGDMSWQEACGHLTWSLGHLKSFLCKQHLPWSDTFGFNRKHPLVFCMSYMQWDMKWLLSVTAWLALFHHGPLRAMAKLYLNFTDSDSHWSVKVHKLDRLPRFGGSEHQLTWRWWWWQHSSFFLSLRLFVA